mmetsp:Transcript_26334/g.53967  ORF Transcript_26334/g.53967 Transcript_26334/m.53967 type:complete len:96 (+) Transcript_26334:70-357(+)
MVTIQSVQIINKEDTPYCLPRNCVEGGWYYLGSRLWPCWNLTQTNICSTLRTQMNRYAIHPVLLLPSLQNQILMRKGDKISSQTQPENVTAGQEI